MSSAPLREASETGNRREDVLPRHVPVYPHQWSTWLRGQEEQAVRTLRLCARTGRPAGDKDFVAQWEKRLGRPLAAKPGGRPRKDTKGQDDKPK